MGVDRRITPANNGRPPDHVLVIPVEHRETLLDLAPNEYGPILESVTTAARAVAAAFDPAGRI